MGKASEIISLLTSINNHLASIEKAIVPHKHDSEQGRYVSGLLIQYGINKAELAARIGVSVPYLSMIANGRRIGAKEKGKLARQVIAESLGMKVEELWPKRAA